ncbi:MAG TPA: DUF58 domain-containing protein [Solirubrobacteraceae bacterium]|nr:DUF58 domain-containing protein [Solirubrobacteraceae bacterium]
MADPAPLLSSDDVRRLERLSIASLDAIEAGLTGQREGPARTAAGLEFAEHRRYTPGDDLRRIDWNVYGRLRELLVKTAPSESRIWLSEMIDASRSMDAGEPNKLWYARRLAALLGTVALLRSDSVQVHVLADGGSIAGGRLDAARMVSVLAREITELPAGTETELARSVARSRAVGERTELGVLISDCLVGAADLEAALAQLAKTARAAVLVHVLDPAEGEAGPTGGVELTDRETGERLRTLVTDQLRVRLAERYQQFRARVQDACVQASAHYVAAPTTIDPLALLLDTARIGRVLRSATVA